MLCSTENALHIVPHVIDVVVIIHKSHADSRWLSAITAGILAILQQSAAAVSRLLTNGRTTLLKHNQAVQILNRANVGPRSSRPNPEQSKRWTPDHHKKYQKSPAQMPHHSRTAPSKPVHRKVDNEDLPSQSKLPS